MELFTADWIHHDGTFRSGCALLVDDAGRVAAAGPEEEVRARPEAAGATERAFPGKALAPGTVSAHSHCFQVLLRGASDHPTGFRDWVKRHLYPLVARLDAESLETAALLCFAQMARAGVTTVGEFHYIHNAPDEAHSPQSRELADVVIRAARRVGLRIAFIRTIYNVQEVMGQGRFAEDLPTALASVRDLHGAYADDPAVSVLPAPHSLHGATEAAVRETAELARELDTLWHVHLAEQKGDIGYSEHLHKSTPLRVLDEWGVLDRRTVLVHGVWLDARERGLVAEKAAGVVSNPTTNMALGDGVADLPDLVARGVPVGLGTDMNATTNVFVEMRTAELLQRVRSLRMGVLAGAGGGAPRPSRLFDMGTEHGARLLGVEAGALAPGRWADLISLDLRDPSLLPAATQGGDALLSATMSAMTAETAVRDVLVGGRTVQEDGRLVGLAEGELAERVRGAEAVPGPA